MPISSKEYSSMAHLVYGLGKLIVQVHCKIYQQITRSSGNLGRINKSEKGEFSNGDGKILCYLMT